jgi:hypothetical protein
MSRRRLSDSDLVGRAYRLGTTLRLCERDDARVIGEVHEKRKADDVESLDKVSFCDDFLHFAQGLGVLDLLNELDPKTRVRATIGWAALIGTYILRLLLGVPSMPQLEGLVLTDPALMGLFALAMFVERGVTRRGLSRAQRLPKVRGAFSGEVIADTLVRCSLLTISRVFNAVMRKLAEGGFFPKNVHAVIDCTDLEATPKFRMLGGVPVASVAREKRPDHRNNRHAPKVYTTVWGWKVWLMFCPVSGIPVAMYVDRINVDDRTWLLALVVQGKENLGGRLRSVSLDRGFWDGQDLWHVAQQVPFFIPGRADLETTKEARRLGLEAYGRWKRGLPVEDALVATRPVRVTTGRGKKRRTEEKLLVVVGLSELPCDTYAKQAPKSKLNSKSFEPGRLQAAVVLEDPTYPSANPDEPLVILTPQPMREAKDALFAYDRFDARGVIENSANKEGKRAWNLEAPLEKSEPAVYLHAHLVFLTMAVMAAFRAQQLTEAKAEAHGEDTGMAQYRRDLQRANRGKAVIRLGNYYAVLWNWELAVLLGLDLNWHPGETAEGILARYGAAPKEVPPCRTSC